MHYLAHATAPVVQLRIPFGVADVPDPRAVFVRYKDSMRGSVLRGRTRPPYRMNFSLLLERKCDRSQNFEARCRTDLQTRAVQAGDVPIIR